MSPARLPCAACGAWAAPAELTAWTSRRRGRRLLVRAAERAGQPGERVSANGLYVERTVAEVRLLCPLCLEEARCGRGLAALSRLRTGRQMAAASLAIFCLYLISPLVEGMMLTLHRGLIEAPPLSVLLDRTYKRYLDRDPTIERRPPGLLRLLPSG